MFSVPFGFLRLAGLCLLTAVAGCRPGPTRAGSDTVTDDAGVAVRVGHHCAWPLHRALDAAATTRASLAVHNTPEDVAALLEALDRVPAIFGLDVTSPARAS